MKYARRWHLYLSCFFAPLLLFYVLSGWYQTFNQNRNKGLGEQDDWLSRLISIHVDQVYPVASAQHFSPAIFRWLVVLMSVSFTITLALGVYLAFKTTKKSWPVLTALGLGFAVPIAALWLGLR